MTVRTCSCVRACMLMTSMGPLIYIYVSLLAYLYSCVRGCVVRVDF